MGEEIPGGREGLGGLDAPEGLTEPPVLAWSLEGAAGARVQHRVGGLQQLLGNWGTGDAFGLGLLVSNQTPALAITWDYKWELYSIKIDSRVN